MASEVVVWEAAVSEVVPSVKMLSSEEASDVVLVELASWPHQQCQ